MHNESYEENKPSFAQKAARAGLFAPFIAIGVNILTISIAAESPAKKMTIGLAVLLIILIGLISAIIGLCGVKKRLSMSKRRGADLLILSLLGLILNGTLIYIAVAGALQFHKMGSVGFSVTSPKGFEEYQEGWKQKSNVFCCYRKADRDNKKDIVLTVFDLDGTISKGDKLESLLPASSNTTFFKKNWKNHQVAAARFEENINGTPTVGFAALVPTVLQALLVKLTGPQEKKMK